MNMQQKQLSAGELQSFLTSLRDIIYFKTDGAPNENWKVFYGSTLNEARRNAIAGVKDYYIKLNEKDGVTDSIGEMSMLCLGKIIKRLDKEFAAEVDDAFYSSGEAAMEQACRSAGGAKAGKKVIYDAGRDAAMMAQLIVLRQLEIRGDGNGVKQTIEEGMELFRFHANERMEAWRKGYAVLADIDGMLYVYCIGKQPNGIDLRVDDSRMDTFLYAG